MCIRDRRERERKRVGAQVFDEYHLILQEREVLGKNKNSSKRLYDKKRSGTGWMIWKGVLLQRERQTHTSCWINEIVERESNTFLKLEFTNHHSSWKATNVWRYADLQSSAGSPTSKANNISKYKTAKWMNETLRRKNNQGYGTEDSRYTNFHVHVYQTSFSKL